MKPKPMIKAIKGILIKRSIFDANSLIKAEVAQKGPFNQNFKFVDRLLDHPFSLLFFSSLRLTFYDDFLNFIDNLFSF